MKEWKPEDNGQPRFETRHKDRIEWARKHLPDEHEGSVVVAMGMLEMIGGREAVTRNAVLARLRAQGKLKSQMKEKV